MDFLKTFFRVKTTPYLEPSPSRPCVPPPACQESAPTEASLRPQAAPLPIDEKKLHAEAQIDENDLLGAINPSPNVPLPLTRTRAPRSLHCEAQTEPALLSAQFAVAS